MLALPELTNRYGLEGTALWADQRCLTFIIDKGFRRSLIIMGCRASFFRYHAMFLW